MTSPDTIQAIELPDYDDPPAIPDDLRVLFYALMSRAVPRFSNTDARDAAYPSPVDGQLCMTGSGTTLRMWTGVGGDWLAFARSSGSGLWAAEMPPSGSVAVNGQRAVAATAYADVAGATLTLDLPARARVRLQAQMWMVTTVAGAGLRAGINVSGATTSGPEAPTPGSAAIQNLGTAASLTLPGSAMKEIDFEAGESIITLQAQRAAGAASVNYPYLSYQVVRWL
ncbi:hypothetical protein SAMN04487781_3999 [Cellulosimicrobium cellulans]|nr:hypothetical protein SAMN04487781_3999 [Cellulosimicrobium cellulans]